MAALTTEQLNAVGIIRYLGDLGPEPATPTYIYQGQRRGFAPGTTVEDAVRSMCNEFSLEYDAVIDLDYGKDYNNKIASVVARKMKAKGYGYDLCFGVALAHLKASLAKLSGATLTDAQTAAISEGDAVETLRQQCITEAYAEYPKGNE